MRWLAFAVAIFTVALACFTFADATIRLRRRWVKWALFGSGVAVALATFVVILLRVDTEGWPLLLAGLVGTPLAGFALWHMFIAAERRGWIHPHADPGHVHPESIGPEPSAIPAPVLPHDLNDRLTTSIVIALAITVPISALSGWGYSSADTQADEMALHARGARSRHGAKTPIFWRGPGEDWPVGQGPSVFRGAVGRDKPTLRPVSPRQGRRRARQTLARRSLFARGYGTRMWTIRGSERMQYREFPQKIVRGAGQSPIPGRSLARGRDWLSSISGNRSRCETPGPHAVSSPCGSGRLGASRPR